MSDVEDNEEEEVLDITHPDVLAKYRLSAEIANSDTHPRSLTYDAFFSLILYL